VDLDYLQESHGELPASIPKQYFLFVGTLKKGKNLALLREVYRLARVQKQEIAPLVIVGVKFLDKLSHGDFPADWEFLGFQKDEQLFALYRSAIALVFPSKFEGFGYPVVEAQALNCPVICSKISSIPEVAGDAAMYAEQTPESYLEMMLLLQSSEAQRHKLTTKGALRVSLFSLAAATSKVETIYRKTMVG
jgi:alpha-1,3-rhamnosyl/mannosyltransferase